MTDKRTELINAVSAHDYVDFIDVNPKWFRDLLTSVGIADPYLRSKPGGEGYQFMGIDIVETTRVERFQLVTPPVMPPQQITPKSTGSRLLGDLEREQLGEINDRVSDLIVFLQQTQAGQRRDRDMQLAIEHVESAAMRAVRAISK